MRILLAEDEPRIADRIVEALVAAGFIVEAVNNGEDAWFQGDTEDYDLVVLDLGLPRMDGLAVLKRWRAAGRDMPVLVLTARGSWPERVEGIDAGADDYIPKPFQMEELLARIRALLRRAAGQGKPVLRAGEIELDPRQMKVTRCGIPVSLSPLEYRLLAFFLHQPDRIVPPSELLEHIYGPDDERDVNALEALLTRLRRKLGPTVIETRRGFGYGLSQHDS